MSNPETVETHESSSAVVKPAAATVDTTTSDTAVVTEAATNGTTTANSGASESNGKSSEVPLAEAADAPAESKTEAEPLAAPVAAATVTTAAKATITTENNDNDDDADIEDADEEDAVVEDDEEEKWFQTLEEQQKEEEDKAAVSQKGQPKDLTAAPKLLQAALKEGQVPALSESEQESDLEHAVKKVEEKKEQEAEAAAAESAAAAAAPAEPHIHQRVRVLRVCGGLCIECHEYISPQIIECTDSKRMTRTIALIVSFFLQHTHGTSLTFSFACSLSSLLLLSSSTSSLSFVRRAVNWIFSCPRRPNIPTLLRAIWTNCKPPWRIPPKKPWKRVPRVRKSARAVRKAARQRKRVRRRRDPKNSKRRNKRMRQPGRMLAAKAVVVLVLVKSPRRFSFNPRI
jgi:chemotaxis protein histidine kinase CheA